MKNANANANSDIKVSDILDKTLINFLKPFIRASLFVYYGVTLIIAYCEIAVNSFFEYRIDMQSKIEYNRGTEITVREPRNNEYKRVDGGGWMRGVSFALV